MIEFSKKKSAMASQMLREMRNQAECSANDMQKKPSRGYDKLDIKNRGNLIKASSLYDKYKAKEVHQYNSRDILYYYKDLAKSKGVKFVSNVSLDNRFMRNIKQALKTYTVFEIIGMYDFIFNSGQTYLDIRKSNPDIIITAFGNTIFADYESYKKGQYVDKSNKKFDKREYQGDKEESSLGQW